MFHSDLFTNNSFRLYFVLIVSLWNGFLNKDRFTWWWWWSSWCSFKITCSKRWTVRNFSPPFISIRVSKLLIWIMQTRFFYLDNNNYCCIVKGHLRTTHFCTIRGLGFVPTVICLISPGESENVNKKTIDWRFLPIPRPTRIFEIGKTSKDTKIFISAKNNNICLRWKVFVIWRDSDCRISTFF